MTSERCIYLVRHGETTGESSIRYHGRNDVPLSELGEQQVARLLPLVQDLQFHAVLHSPLDRARVSANILLDGLRHPPGLVEEVADFTELGFGAMEGLTAEEIAVREPAWFAEWQAGRADGFPGGEKFAGFAERVQRTVDDVLARHPDGDLLLVAHKGIIKRAVGHLLGLSTEAVKRLDPALGSLSVLWCGEQVKLERWSVLPDSS